MTRPIRGVLFDKDGTLFDFTATWRAYVFELLEVLAPGDSALQARLGADVGFDHDSGAFTPGSLIVAGATGDIAQAWAQRLPAWSPARIVAAADARALSATLSPSADLAALTATLRGMGCVLGVATHDTEAAAIDQLTREGVLEQFAFVAGYDSGHGLKPGPGMVQAFCAATGLDAAEVAMIGDSIHDLGAGRSAGAGLVVGVLTGPAPESTLAPLADVVLPSIAALPACLTRRDGGNAT